MAPQIRKVDEAFDGSQKMIFGYVPFQRKLVEERLLNRLPFAHHRLHSAAPCSESADSALRNSGVFQHNRPRADIRLRLQSSEVYSRPDLSDLNHVLEDGFIGFGGGK